MEFLLCMAIAALFTGGRAVSDVVHGVKGTTPPHLEKARLKAEREKARSARPSRRGSRPGDDKPTLLDVARVYRGNVWQDAIDHVERSKAEKRARKAALANGEPVPAKPSAAGRAKRLAQLLWQPVGEKESAGDAPAVGGPSARPPWVDPPRPGPPKDDTAEVLAGAQAVFAGEMRRRASLSPEAARREEEERERFNAARRDQEEARLTQMRAAAQLVVDEARDAYHRGDWAACADRLDELKDRHDLVYGTAWLESTSPDHSPAIVSLPQWHEEARRRADLADQGLPTPTPAFSATSTATATQGEATMPNPSASEQMAAGDRFAAYVRSQTPDSTSRAVSNVHNRNTPRTSATGSFAAMASTGEAVNYETTVVELGTLIETLNGHVDQAGAALKAIQDAKSAINNAQQSYNPAAEAAGSINEHLTAMNLDATTVGHTGTIADAMPPNVVDQMFDQLEAMEQAAQEQLSNAEIALGSAAEALSTVHEKYGDAASTVAGELSGDSRFLASNAA